MYNQRVIDPKQLPISIGRRRYTDVICTLFHSLFVLTLLVFALMMHFQKINQQNSGVCQQGYYQLQSQTEGNPSSCIQVCPQYYIISGNMCVPNNAQPQASSLSPPNSNSKQANNFSLQQIIIFLSIFTFSLSVALFTISYLLSKFYPHFIICTTILIIIGIALTIKLSYLILEALKQWYEDLTTTELIIISVIVGILVVMLISWIICFHKNLNWDGLLIESATRVLVQNPSIMFLVVNYYFWAFITTGIFIFEHWVFAGNSLIGVLAIPNFNILVVLNVFQLIWNLQILKDSYQMHLSNIANHQYWNKDFSFCDSFAINWIHRGSLCGGAFVNIILTIPNLFAQVICCFPQENRQTCGLCCTSLSGLTRTDAYSYVSLTSLPFCNASRECRRLGNQSTLWKGNVSPLQNIRIISHLFIDIVIVFVGIILMLNFKQNINIWVIFLMIMLCQLISSGFGIKFADFTTDRYFPVCQSIFLIGQLKNCVFLAVGEYPRLRYKKSLEKMIRTFIRVSIANINSCLFYYLFHIVEFISVLSACITN